LGAKRFLKTVGKGLYTCCVLGCNRYVDSAISKVRAGYVILLMLALLLGGMTRGAPGRGSLPSWYTPYSVGYDVSWPNCTQKPPADTSWGVVGVTGGLSFKPNPCMATEATWFKQYALYINTGYPGRDRALRYAHTPQPAPVTMSFAWPITTATTPPITPYAWPASKICTPAGGGWM